MLQHLCRWRVWSSQCEVIQGFAHVLWDCNRFMASVLFDSIIFFNICEWSNLVIGSCLLIDFLYGPSPILSIHHPWPTHHRSPLDLPIQLLGDAKQPSTVSTRETEGLPGAESVPWGQISSIAENLAVSLTRMRYGQWRTGSAHRRLMARCVARWRSCQKP